MNVGPESQDIQRGPWYLLTGFLVGAALGLVYAWAISPLQYVDTPPAALREDFKDQYRASIAAAFAANGDMARAQARLALLGDEDSYRVVAAQAQRSLAQGGAPQDARALGILAAALREPDSGGGTPLAVVSPDPGVVTPEPTALISSITREPTETPRVTPTRTPRPTRTLTPTRTPLPTRTPTATPGAPFTLADQEAVCDPDLAAPLIRVRVYDAADQPVPGVAIIASGPDGEQRFFTGLKPELGLEYADLTMVPGFAYTLRLADGGAAVEGLVAQDCTASGRGQYWGGWDLTFTQPEP